MTFLVFGTVGQGNIEVYRPANAGRFGASIRAFVLAGLSWVFRCPITMSLLQPFQDGLPLLLTFLFVSGAFCGPSQFFRLFLHALKIIVLVRRLLLVHLEPHCDGGLEALGVEG